MVFTSRPLHAQRGVTLAVALLCALTAGGAQAQARWTVIPKLSLAWWQMSPHLNHLWATTCPQDTSWRPGEGRSGGWSVKGRPENKSKTGFQNVGDTVNVPLYPRTTPEPVCTEAVRGLVLVADTVTWRVLSGEVGVKVGALVTAEDRRDAYAKRVILQSDRYPEVRFKIDSLVGMTRQGDTVHCTAVGLITIRATTKPLTADIRFYPEAGELRVLGRLRFPAGDLVPVYGISQWALGLGWGTKIWQDFFMGVDLVLHRERAAGE